MFVGGFEGFVLGWYVVMGSYIGGFLVVFGFLYFWGRFL